MVTKMTPFYFTCSALNVLLNGKVLFEVTMFQIYSDNKRCSQKVLLKRDLAWPFSHPAVFALQLTSLYMYISTVFADNCAHVSQRISMF